MKIQAGVTTEKTDMTLYGY